MPKPLRHRGRAGAPLPRRRPRAQARRRGGEGRVRWTLVGAGIGGVVLVLALGIGALTSNSTARTAGRTSPAPKPTASEVAVRPPAASADPEVTAAATETPPLTGVQPPVALGPLPACTHDDLPATVDAAHPELTLLDTAYGIPAAMGPSATVAIGDAGLAGRGAIAVEALPDLQALVTASREAGVRLIAVSGHRTYDEQARMFDIWQSRYGRDAALRSSARAGHSEHQLGYALDFSSQGVFDPWNADDWARTPEGAWMRDNAWRFGWVMSYPPERTDVTCYAYEPWHYRWVGREIAAAVHDAGLTLREFLWERQRP